MWRGRDRGLVLGAALLVGLTLAGCDRHTSETAQTPSSTGAKNAAAVALKKAKLIDLNDYLEAQKGKVVVVDFWHYLCDPCKEEFPNLVKIHKKYEGKVVCVSVAMGLELEKFYDKSLKFLQKQGAEFTNFIL